MRGLEGHPCGASALYTSSGLARAAQMCSFSVELIPFLLVGWLLDFRFCRCEKYTRGPVNPNDDKQRPGETPRSRLIQGVALSLNDAENRHFCKEGPKKR